MRPWIIMGSAVSIALLMVTVLLLPAGISVYRQFVYGGAAPKYYPEGTVIVRREPSRPIGQSRSVPGMRTTVEHPGGVNLASQKDWDFSCVTLLSAPKTMEVGNTADVETDLLTTTDRGKVDALMSVVQHAADALNKGVPFASTATSALALAELNPEAADAIRRMTHETGDRQAATDTLPGSPIMTAHLTGPGFDITPDTPERQAVTTKTPAIWRWTIKAVDPGERTLTVSYSAEVLIADQRVPQSLRTISRTVNVSVAPAGLLKQAAEKTSFVKSIAESASWFWTTLILPALMFLYGLRKWFRERHAATPQPTGGG
jgi:hypothetical protein